MRAIRLIPALLPLLVGVLAAAPLAADSLCIDVTMNDRPAGEETTLRLLASGQPAREVHPAEGRVRVDALPPGKWTIQLSHPQTRTIRNRVTVSGATGVLLDCGHADEWSGCQVKPRPGC